MIQLVLIAITAVIACLFIGYLTPKVLYFGIIAVIGTRGIALLLPVEPPVLVPYLVDIMMVYPTAISNTYASQTAQYGTTGGIVTVGVAIFLSIPYLVGVFFGTTTYPELFVLRWIF